MRTRSILLLTALIAALPALASAEPIDPLSIDCFGPAPDAEPGTSAWLQRDLENSFCNEQRHLDQVVHPNAGLTIPGPTQDAYRDPARHDGSRFRFTATTIGSITTEVYRPCAEGSCDGLPAGLSTHEPPYPTVIVLHGATSRKEYNWWASQPLAEAGFLVIAPDTTGSVAAILNWLQSGPFADEIDHDRVGIAGHSAGGLSANAQQGNPRISAIVLWDGGSTSLPGVKADARTPALYQTPDGGARTPTPHLQEEDRIGGGYGAAGFQTLRDRDVDSMVIVGRATNHLDWVGGEIWGSRYAELLWSYFNIAWFDRYLKGKLVGDEDADEEALRIELASDAFARLTADAFDDSADVHNISQGLWDPDLAQASGDLLYGGNIPYTLAGSSIADRLAFYYRSACFLADPASAARAASDDIRREGCTTS